VAAKRPRGRPARTDWLTAGQLARVPIGTAVAIDLGDKKAVIRGRVAGVLGSELVLAGGQTIQLTRVRRARVVNGTYEPGDLVLRPGVPESEWRGGVVRCRGREVYVESTEGFAWMSEDLLEPAESRPSNARAREEGHSPKSAA
jgi:hypothetical protein